MGRLSATVLSLVLWASPAFATIGYPMVNLSKETISTSATTYLGLMGYGDAGSASATETDNYQIIPAAGVIHRLYVEVTTAPENGAGTQSWTVTFRSGATRGTIADSLLTCSFSESQTGCSDQNNRVTISAGDRVSYSIVPANTPAAPVNVRIVAMWEPTTAGNYFLTAGNATDVSGTGTQFFGLAGDSIRDATEADKYFIIGKQATVKNLYVEIGVDPAGGAGTQSWTWTARDCGPYTSVSCANSVVTCAINEGSTSCSDTANSFTIHAEDMMTMAAAPANTPTAYGDIHVAILLQMADPLTWVTAVTQQTNLSTTATEYLSILTEEDDPDATVASHESLMLESFLTGIWVRLNADPGTSPDAYAFTVQQNQADTACTVSIVANDTTGELTSCRVRFSRGDEANIEITPVSTPATAVTRTQIGLAWSYRKRAKVLVH